MSHGGPKQTPGMDLKPLFLFFYFEFIMLRRQEILSTGELSLPSCLIFFLNTSEATFWGFFNFITRGIAANIYTDLNISVSQNG